MKDFRKLQVWEKTHNLALSVDTATANFPKDGICGLTAQLRRSSVSIAAELARFLQIAMGSASELEYHLLPSRDLQILNETDYPSLVGTAVEVKKKL
jgi:four helix bundle protein